MPSSVPAAKAALLSLIQARSGLSDLQAAEAISWGHPTNLLRTEHVWIDDALFEDEDVVAMRTAPHPKEETYVLPVAVFLLNEGTVVSSAVKQTMELRWWAIVAEIEAAVAASPTLSATPGVHSALVISKTPHTGVNEIGKTGWVHEGVVSVRVKARISG